jgi:ribose transport system substrate-binding protein
MPRRSVPTLCFLLWTAFSVAGLGADKTFVFGVIAKSNNNPFFQPARFGAEDEAKSLGQRDGVDIKIDWRTPDQEDAAKQATAIDQLVGSGASGIAISCSEANKVTDAINRAVDAGVPVVTFDSDAPGSKRLAWFGIDNYKCGQTVMSELAKELNGKGIVAVLAGNQNAPNLQLRVKGILDEAEKYPGIHVIGTYYHTESPQDAAARVDQVMKAHSDITGWAFAGGWPLFTDHALKWPPGAIKVTCVDALPPEIAYLKAGYVQVLLAQNVYDWAARAIDTLYDYVAHGKKPENPTTAYDLIPVTKDNADQYLKNWDKWLGKGTVK